MRVLIVEGEAIVLMQLQDILEDAGHVVVDTAMSAKEAIASIEQHSPELILLDLHLQGGSSGLDVVAVVRDLANTLVVFVTANVSKLAEDLDGAVAAIAKPFSQETIEGALAYPEEWAHRPPPLARLPLGLQLAPAYAARHTEMRAAT